MKITRKAAADKIGAYLRHDIPLERLVAWAEGAMLDGEFTKTDAAALTEVVSRIGVADVRAFGLTWDDCEKLLRRLGFAARVEVVAA